MTKDYTTRKQKESLWEVGYWRKKNRGMETTETSWLKNTKMKGTQYFCVCWWKSDWLPMGLTCSHFRAPERFIRTGLANNDAKDVTQLLFTYLHLRHMAWPYEKDRDSTVRGDYLVQRAHRASICSCSSMLQCLGRRLESTLPEAESIKGSSSSRRLSCDTCTQNRSCLPWRFKNNFWEFLGTDWQTDCSHWPPCLLKYGRMSETTTFGQQSYLPAAGSTQRGHYVSGAPPRTTAAVAHSCRQGTSGCLTHLCMLNRMFFVY